MVEADRRVVAPVALVLARRRSLPGFLVAPLAVSALAPVAELGIVQRAGRRGGGVGLHRGGLVGFHLGPQDRRGVGAEIGGGRRCRVVTRVAGAGCWLLWSRRRGGRRGGVQGSEDVLQEVELLGSKLSGHVRILDCSKRREVADRP